MEIHRKISIAMISSLVVILLTAPAGVWAAEGHGDHSKHEMKTDAQTGHEGHMAPAAVSTASTEEAGLIHMDTPAGYNVVIGRKNPIPELPHETVKEDGKTYKVFRLTVEDIELELYPGKKASAWGFNGSVPGPTIRVNEGDHVRVVLTNKTDDKHTIHFHGQTKPLVMDGVPFIGQNPVAKDETFTYEFQITRAGTHWYHCHVDSAHHVDMGMYGALIVEPKRESVKFDREYVWMLDEWPGGHEHMHETPMEGHENHGVVTEHKGEARHAQPDEKPAMRDWYPETYNPYDPVYDTFLINGKAFPFTEPLDVREGERVLIRLINAGYEPHYIHTHSHRFKVVARDGSPIAEPQEMDTVGVGPGQRVDLLLLADNPGVWPVHCHRLVHVANDKIYPGGMMAIMRYID